jgi:hypothetical protein
MGGVGSRTAEECDENDGRWGLYAFTDGKHRKSTGAAHSVRRVDDMLRLTHRHRYRRSNVYLPGSARFLSRFDFL